MPFTMTTSAPTTFEVPSDRQPSIAEATKLARAILLDVFRYRRFSGLEAACVTTPCERCLEPHLPRIVAAIVRQEPITFVLPAFPGKSPNPAKVFGPLPDMAERRALEFLQQLADRVKRHHAPGARIILASDGRIFSDVVGLRDEDVTAYQDELARMIVGLGLTSITTFNLEELYGHLSFDEMRSQVMEDFGEPLEDLKASVKRGNADDASLDDQEALRLYCGITRFLVEDATFPGQTKSRTALQKEARTRAYEVIQRSKAWGGVVDREFPAAVRLSIHPQGCGAKKLGIQLVGQDSWMTPWHGVAVEVGGHYVLYSRAQAEALGARLVSRFGRPSHFVLSDALAS